MEVRNLDIPTLFREFDYKEKFTEIQWKTICLFEYHFSKYIHRKTFEDDKYEKLVAKKYQFWEEVLSAKQLSTSLVQWSNREILDTFQRKAAAADKEKNINM